MTADKGSKYDIKANVGLTGKLVHFIFDHDRIEIISVDAMNYQVAEENSRSSNVDRKKMEVIV